MIGAPNCSPGDTGDALLIIVLFIAADCARSAGGPTNGLESSAPRW
jgi:hypothetical protein